jgi:enoyl-CoA hydratase/carnithine racemase
MEENLLLTEKEDRILTIAFNRPERRNSLSPLLLHEFSTLLGRVQKEDEVRCLVLRGAGDKAFSSGYDIMALPTEVSPEVMETLRKTNPLETALQAIRDFPYPVIAMINGMAFGAGCEVAAACDIRVANETARMGMPPAKLGLIYLPAGIYRFINVVGAANAKEIFFRGHYFPASRAREMGLLNYVVPDDQLVSFTMDIAREISGNAPLSLKGMKFVFNACLKHQKIAPEDMKEIERLAAEAFSSEDLKEGQKAFKEKRKPVFQGR